jgi:hypothetical protein
MEGVDTVAALGATWRDFLRGFSDKGFTTRGSANEMGGRNVADDSVDGHVVSEETGLLELRKSDLRFSRRKFAKSP